MKKIRGHKKIHIILALVLICSFVLINMVQGETVEPGSDSDPLVTRSYVDSKTLEVLSQVDQLSTSNTEQENRINQIDIKIDDFNRTIEQFGLNINQIDESMSGLTVKITETVDSQITANNKITEVENKLSELEQNGNTISEDIESLSQASKFEVIQVKAGQQLIGGASTEIIVRSGKATAIASELGGLSDLISGKDILSGVEITNNHLLLLPRDDGRGLKAETDIWILIKGLYTINEV